ALHTCCFCSHLQPYVDHCPLLSFPTRRSSDLTGLTQEDFKVLCDLGVFNRATMDSAVFAFRRFELASLDYIGGGKEKPEYYGGRSEEHTSELQSRFDLVCRLLLEKKNVKNTHH